MLSLKFLPAGAACGLVALWRQNDTKLASARSDFEIVEDKFQTVDFYNTYKKIQVYGYHGCPYCAKVRAYLRFRGIDFEDIEVNALTKAELKSVVPGYKKVPVVIVKDQNDNTEAVIKDSGVIISMFEQVLDGVPFKFSDIARFYIAEDGKVIEENVFSNLQKEKVDPNRKFVQDGLLHTVAPNIYPSISLSIKNSFEFQSRSEKFKDNLMGYLISIIGGFIMYFVSLSLLKKFRENPDQTASQYLDSQVEKFLAEKGDAQFLGGDRCSVGDVEAWGVINLTEGTTAFAEYEKHPELMQWYYAVQRHVMTHQGMGEGKDE